jgi:peroxiredoxin
MKVKLLIVLIVLGCIGNVCLAKKIKTNETTIEKKELHDYKLEIIMHNYVNSGEVWIIMKYDPKIGLVPIDINTGERFTKQPSVFKSSDGKFSIEGKLKEPNLYLLFNTKTEQTIPFIMEPGCLTIELNQKDLLNKKDQFQIIPFKHSKSKLNEELLKFWNTEEMKEIAGGYSDYINWYNNSVKDLWGLSIDEYFNKMLSGGLTEIKEKRKITNNQIEAISKEQKDRLLNIHIAKEKAISSYLNENPKSIVGLMYLSATLYSYGQRQPSVRQRWKHLQLIDKELRQHEIYEVLRSRYSKLNKVKVGDPAPDFELTDTKGNKIRLSDLRGNVVLVEFWKSDCDYCKDENKNLHQIYSKYHNKDFEIISVSFDESESEWRKSLELNGNSWLNVREPKGFEKSNIIQDYVEAGVPYYFLLDKDGKFVAKNLRQAAFAIDKEHDIDVQLKKLFLSEELK